MKMLLFHNPSAGTEKTSRGELTEALGRRKCDLIYRSTSRDDWQEEIPTDVDLVAVAGGDGALRTVFGLLAGGPGVPVLPLATGTANNIARSLGLENWRRVADSLPDLTTRPFCFGRVAGGRDELFFEGVGMGLLARLIEVAETDDDRLATLRGARSGFAGDRCALAALAREAEPFTLSASGGGKRIERNVLWAEVLNIRSLGPLIHFGDEVPVGPPQGLTLVIVPADRRDELIRHLEATCGDVETRIPEAELHPFGDSLKLSWHGGRHHVDDELHEASGPDRCLRIERLPTPLPILGSGF